MNATGIFYVANNLAYYMQRNGNTANWEWVENNVTNFQVRPNGDTWCRNSHYSNGGVFANNEGTFGFYLSGSNKIWALAPNWYWQWLGVNGTLQRYSQALGNFQFIIRNR